MLGNPHVCGGVLLSLNPAIVLTAAHCVADAPHPFTIEKNPYFAAYSHIDRKKQKINAIDDWVVHPNYNISNNVDMHYDLALVKLKDPLEQSDRVDRVALWPADGRLLSFDGKLMGFGFLIKDGPEARRLQSIDVKVTKLASGLRDMVEAISADDEQRACHGDSGSPLIIRQSVNNATAPYALGLLARIFGVHDLDPDHATCPQPFKKNSKVPTITESFCNVSNMLDWISEITGISVANLTDPFYHDAGQHQNLMAL
ncbi:hypothetical protein LRAMOSA10475 [Lichtheimia ramosa]|uniref:Peptidase S1 domain-containing protein n=1 Tax=Lichtheimia ramosa TaxID=688394 RepID=A0A077WP09_9FUNG|nr:hypothetical protein LRAMOSA10475 [Lichtheimia ramosa]